MNIRTALVHLESMEALLNDIEDALSLHPYVHENVCVRQFRIELEGLIVVSRKALRREETTKFNDIILKCKQDNMGGQQAIVKG